MYFKHFIKKMYFNPPTPWSGRMISGAKALSSRVLIQLKPAQPLATLIRNKANLIKPQIFLYWSLNLESSKRISI